MNQLVFSKIAMSELRSLRRLIRSKVAACLFIFVTVTVFVLYAQDYVEGSTYSLVAGDNSPRYASVFFSETLLWLSMALVLLVGFDRHHRNERDQIAEVLDSKPVANGTYLFAYLVTLVLAVWIPLTIAVLGLQTVVGLASAFELLSVPPMEPVSLTTFVVFDSPVALSVWCAVIIFLQTVMKSRVLIVISATTLLVTYVWIGHVALAYLTPLVSMVSHGNDLASDLASRLPDSRAFLQHLSMMLFAVALTLGAAGLSPRRDRKRRMYTSSSLGCATLALTLFGTLTFGLNSDLDRRQAWMEERQKLNDERSRQFTVLKISGDVRVEPGKNLGLDIQLDLKTASSVELQELLFSFNPGMRIEELRIEERQAEFRHVAGVLTVDLEEPLQPGSNTTLHMTAAGVPDPDFAYLGGLDWRNKSRRNTILPLGTAGSIYHPEFVALMPDLHWIPSTPQSASNARTRTPFAVDLMILAPDEWLVAGASREHNKGSETSSKFRFHPAAPVNGLVLIASRFKRFATHIAQIEFELLLHPDHLRNVFYNQDIVNQLTARVKQIAEDARNVGLPYPYDRFTVVEVPSYLRTYDQNGDTTLAQPRMLLLREQGFPHARFDHSYLNEISFLRDDADQIAGMRLQQLENMLASPFGGGSLQEAWSRNLADFSDRCDWRWRTNYEPDL